MTATSRMTRKAALAAAILGATLILPGSAVASHNPGNHRNPYVCNPSVAGDCPAFEGNALFQLSNPVKGSLSSVNFMFSQPDRRMPVMKADYYLPAGWRFGGLADIDPALQADGVTPATDCSQIHNADGSLRNAEGLSADTGMLIQIDGHRFDDPDDFSEALDAVFNGEPNHENDPPAEYGYRPSDPITGNPRRYPSVSFLSWDGTTAKLCYHHRNNMNSTTKGTLPATFIGSATLTRLAENPSFDWRLSLDLSHAYKNANTQAEKANILKHTVSLNALTSGTWNRFHGELSRQPFSRTPETAGDYPFQAQLFTCANGLNLSTTTGCAGDAYSAPIVVDQSVRIAPAPDLVPHDFGKLTGPKTAGLCTNANCPLGLTMGETGFTASWNHPTLAEGQAVMGYVLTVARPGNQASRKHFRLITNPAAPGGQTSTACGASGTDPCSLALNFPMQSTDGSVALTPQGKYHLALVTIFMKDARRTDGLCDGGGTDDGSGVACPSSVTPLRGGQYEGNLLEPGISEWQVLMLKEVWPLVYVSTADDSNNSTYDEITNELLLLDFNRKAGKFIQWVTNDDVLTYSAISSTIIGDNDLGLGVADFGSPQTVGAVRNWRVTAVVTPGLGVSGAFYAYDPKNPSLNPPAISAWPEYAATIYLFMGEL